MGDPRTALGEPGEFVVVAVNGMGKDAFPPEEG